MDRNVVIATVLIAAIMFVWLYWLAPPPPDPAAQQGSPADTQMVEQVPLESEPEVSDVPPAPTDSSFASVAQGEARTVTVETDLYEAKLSTKGGTLVSFLLKDYKKFDQETPVQLVDTSGAGALALVFTTPQSYNVDTRSLYFASDTETDVVSVTDDSVSISFTAQLGGGVLRHTYTFKPDTYEVGLRVDQENAASFLTNEGYELVWDSHIPFTEDNPEDELMHSGAYARSGGEVESVVPGDGDYAEQTLTGVVDWGAVKNKYFTAVMIPSEPTRGAELIGELRDVGEGEQVPENFTVRLLMPPATGGTDTYRLYLGPLEFYHITDYGLGLYDMVDYGYDFFEWITRPLAKYVFIPVFTLMSKFIPSYGIIIIIFAFLVKLVLFPLTKSSYKNMARMRELAPKMQAIKEQYADNPQKQQEATMKMYKETGINPLGGCLPMLFQWPVILALWQFFQQSIEIRQQSFLWANDLSAPDVILSLPFTIPFYGDYVAGFTLLMAVSMVFQMRLQTNPGSNAQAKVIMYVMPIMLFFFFNRLAAGLSLYYLCYNVLTAFQQKYINHSLEKQGIGVSGNGKDDKKGKPTAPRKSKNGQRGGSRSKNGTGRKSSKRIRT